MKQLGGSRSVTQRIIGLGAIAVTMGVTACGTSASDDAGSSTTTDAAVLAEFNDGDVQFARNMIPHHRQAVEMAVLALDGPVEAGAEVRDLASRIERAQAPEIDQMSSWLDVWEGDGSAETDGTQAMGEMGGMMTDEEMQSLGELRGDEFDRRWLEMMIRHHRGAIDMAEAEISDGANPDAVQLAGEIVAAQQAEIAEMRRLLRN